MGNEKSSAFNIPAFGRVEAEAMMEEYGYCKHSDCRELVLAAHARGYKDALSTPPVDAVPGEPVDAETWAELYRLREAVKGPKGFATWQDAAVDERHRRVKAEAALAASVAVPVEPVASAAERDLLAERRRQVEAEGYSADHDAAHGTSELSLAAAAYALSSAHGLTAKSLSPWPWETRSFKPKHPYRDLERAGALVLAAMECWQRRLSKNLASDQEFIESRHLAASVASRAGSEPVAREPWLLYLSDRADGVKGHFAIARWNPKGYREVWNLRRHEWSSFSDDVLTREQADTLLRQLVVPTATEAAAEPSEPTAEVKAALHRALLKSVQVLPDRERAASLVAVRNKALEEAARACEKLAEERFNDHGTREPDTGACYYGGRVEAEYTTRDEEDDECAKAIRALVSAGEAKS